MRSFRSFVAACTAIGVTTLSLPAPAQITLQLDSDTPSTEYRVFAGKRAKTPWFGCMAPCTTSVPSGEYRIESTAPEMPGGKTVVTVATPTRVTTHGGASGPKTTGLVLGIVGSTMTAVGLIGAIIESMPTFSDGCGGNVSCTESPQHAQQRRDAAYAFLAVAGVGALGSIVGWTMFASNRTHVETTYAPPPPPPITVGVAPTPGGGAVLGFQGGF